MAIAIEDEIKRLKQENDRLQDAKRRALALADELAIEANKLRQERDHLSDAAQTLLSERDEARNQLVSIVEPAKALLNEIATSGTHQTWKRLNNAVHALTDEQGKS